jgi:hypothetical protein
VDIVVAAIDIVYCYVAAAVHIVYCHVLALSSFSFG